MEMKLSPEILAYYQQAAESTRLQSGPSQLEFARTQEFTRIAPVGSNSSPPRNSTDPTSSPRRRKPPDFPFCRSTVWRGRDGCFLTSMSDGKIRADVRMFYESLERWNQSCLIQAVSAHILVVARRDA
jgi:hypothetical protein